MDGVRQCIVQSVFQGAQYRKTAITNTSTQLIFTCSKSAIETLERGVDFKQVSVSWVYTYLLLNTLNEYKLTNLQESVFKLSF